eukprot:GILK01014038.1.p1 GENE.GILK01014038.1~~GILK01014038.1.p1  ORF type:complete len:347 (+),score=31.87 GILK01014038.1:126-1166(+)
MRPSLPTTATSAVSEGLTSLQANYFPASFSVGSSGFPSEFHALLNAQQAQFQAQNWALQSLPSSSVPVNFVECISQLQSQIVDIYHLIRQQDMLVKSLSDEISNVREYILHPQTRGFAPLVNSPRSAFSSLPSPLSSEQLPVPIGAGASQNVLPAMRTSSFDEAYKESPPSSKRLKTGSLPTPGPLAWPPSGSPRDTQLSQPTTALVSELTIRPISELSVPRKLGKEIQLARTTSGDSQQPTAASSSLDVQSETKPVVPLKKSSSFPVDSPRGIQKSLSMPSKLPLNASPAEDKAAKRIAVERTCSVCGSKNTPRWRWADDGTRVCNACGLAEIYKKKKIAEFESL